MVNWGDICSWVSGWFVFWLVYLFHMLNFCEIVTHRILTVFREFELVGKFFEFKIVGLKVILSRDY